MSDLKIEVDENSRSARMKKSDALAQLVCRELRYQMALHCNWEPKVLFDRLDKWMAKTGKVKYERPLNKK